MKIISTLALAATALSLKSAHAHSSLSEGAVHTAEHFWLLLVPAVLWLLWSVVKSQSKGSKLTGNGKFGE